MASPEFNLRYEPVIDLSEYARIPSQFEAKTVFDVCLIETGFELVERIIEKPYLKNYDEFEAPLSWLHSFDTSAWGLVTVFVDGLRCGGAVIAFATHGVDMLEGRQDLAVLWDMRIASEYQRQGLGKKLFAAAENWARERGCVELKIETQNTNPSACKFYQAQGCTLSDVRHGVYPELPRDVQLIWRKRIDIHNEATHKTISSYA
jgi:GNAT superfamily N-acetyltransferase